MDKIYTITGTTKLTTTKNGWPDFGSTRTFGYYTDKNKAINAVKENALDIRETIYDYMIIEEVNEGLYAPALNRWFFKATNQNTFKPIEEPSFMNHFAGISMR